ncbi:MAG TPA: hypothetical protein RMG48_05710 [Myxococcales bacterium LLY-WYZ-16_1]|nr:hypothetical protein [Myxococcales bacterium LLY-WYZ-16_1]
MRWMLLGFVLAACEGPHAPDAAPRLDLDPGATLSAQYETLKTFFESRRARIDWKSDSVVKRLDWALSDAQRALAQGDRAQAEARLADARRLLEVY